MEIKLKQIRKVMNTSDVTAAFPLPPEWWVNCESIEEIKQRAPPSIHDKEDVIVFGGPFPLRTGSHWHRPVFESSEMPDLDRMSVSEKCNLLKGPIKKAILANFAHLLCSSHHHDLAAKHSNLNTQEDTTSSHHNSTSNSHLDDEFIKKKILILKEHENCDNSNQLESLLRAQHAAMFILNDLRRIQVSCQSYVLMFKSL